ncbi:hypothetical protein F5Y02DRAFT_147612 [Annulohypoxylon stygium]|nr:hypothetical protein F5Y02DRAFT_147612 [Annulohypoxylon stygium]
METTHNLAPFIIRAIFPEKKKTNTMSHTQDKAHSSAMLGAILDGEKAQQQQQQQAQTSSDSASIFSTSSFGSAKALLKKHGKKSSKKDSSSSSSGSGSGSKSTEDEMMRLAQKNQVRMGF